MAGSSSGTRRPGGGGGGERGGAATAARRRGALVALTPALLLLLLSSSAATAQPELGIALPGATAPAAPTRCIPVSGEFVLTGLTNPDGNRVNHELGICLPQFSFEVQSDCSLSLVATPGQGNAALSLFTTGVDANGQPSAPRATDPPAAVAEFVNWRFGHYYLRPKQCPKSYSYSIRGAHLLGEDLAEAIRLGLGIGPEVLRSVEITPTGLVARWALTDPARPNGLVYTAIAKEGGATTPDFSAAEGSPSRFCPLLDINARPDLDANPQDSVADSSTVSLVARVPKPVPGRGNSFVCAIAPAGGLSTVRRSGEVPTAAPFASVGAFGFTSSGNNPMRYAFEAVAPNDYRPCPAGTQSYVLGALGLPGDGTADRCFECPRGAFSTEGAALCAACPESTYQSKTGQRSCSRCQYGYAPYEGATRCMDCYYGRPYCSEGFSPDERRFTCNSRRLPEGYSPDVGFTAVTLAEEPVNGFVAAAHTPMFASCDVRQAAGATMMFNVSADCGVSWFVLGDLGKGDKAPCSQNAALNSVKGYYVAPNTLAGLDTPSKIKGLTTAHYGILGPAGLEVRVFAASLQGNPVPAAVAPQTGLTLALPQTGYGYLGGGDNGQGQNAGVRGVNWGGCPAGTVRVMLNGDGVEDPGEDPNQLLAFYCVACDVGHYCPEGSEDYGKYCPAGTFGAAIGAKSPEGCVNCAVGTFNPSEGAFECEVCPPDTFASSPGATECMACGDGYEVASSGSNFCNPCKSGWYRNAAEADKCQQCPAGTSSSPAAGACEVCQPGSYSKTAGSTACTPCPRGTSQSQYASDSCVSCPEGTYADARGLANCKVCPGGTFNDKCGAFSSSACRSCPAGTAAPRPGSGSCAACGAGFFNDKGGQKTCRACPVGSYTSDAKAVECTKCPKGTYADLTASKECKACEMGFYAPYEGSSRCLPCPTGSFTTEPGASSCARCAPGTYSTRTGADDVATCAPCPAGSFSYAYGSTSCQSCAAGYHAPSEGSTSCRICALGTYAPSGGATRCLACRDGFTTARQGATSVGECSVSVELNGGGGMFRRRKKA